MEFMISSFGSESTGRPRSRRRIRVSSVGIDENNQQTLVNMDDKSNDNQFNGIDTNANRLPPEIEEGNVEYKMKLVTPSAIRIQHLVTQLKWRLREGGGEAIYEIGVEDDGELTGLDDDELNASLDTLNQMCTQLQASMVILRERDVTQTNRRRRVVEILIRKVPDSQQFIELRLAVLGCADAGKSTLCGVLTQGQLDNGRGRARLNLFRHLHEVQTGRTSSISLDVFGFDSTGQVVNYADHSLEQIVAKSTKLVTLIDLAGHYKYLRTTIYGLTGHKPHFVMLVIAANAGPIGTTKEHFGLAIALNLPVFIVVTKVDITSQTTLNKTIVTIEALLRLSGSKRTVIRRIRSMDDAVSAATSLDASIDVPLFTLSNVTGTNLDLIKCFLNVLPPNDLSRRQTSEKISSTLLNIDEIFHVPNVGTVVCGLLADGIINENDQLKVGPDNNGCFHRIVVDSVQRNKQPCRLVRAGQAASLAVSLINDADHLDIRKGMILVGKDDQPIACWQFDARVCVLYHPSHEICVGFQATVYIGNVCQTATIKTMDKSSLRVCHWANVRFAFYRQPESVRPGARLIFREGKTKGMGEVLRILVSNNNNNSSNGSKVKRVK